MRSLARTSVRARVLEILLTIRVRRAEEGSRASRGGHRVG